MCYLLPKNKEPGFSRAFALCAETADSNARVLRAGKDRANYNIGHAAVPGYTFSPNPIRSEKVNSLARYVAQLSRVAWDDAARSLLDRTMDESANRRVSLPNAFLATDELLAAVGFLFRSLRANEVAIGQTLERFGPFAAIEPLLMHLVKADADRQAMHELLRNLAMRAWARVDEGKRNILVELLVNDERLCEYLSPESIRAAVDVCSYVGDAPQRALCLAGRIRDAVGAP